MKVTAKPLTGLRKSSTASLRCGRGRGISASGELTGPRALGQDAVIVRQVHGRHWEGLAELLVEGSIRRRPLLSPPLGREIDREQPDQHGGDDRAAGDVAEEPA